MPKIPVHQAGRLASEQVGVPSQDQSGVIVAEAFTRVAGKMYSVIDEAVTKQKNLLDQAELSKAVSSFDSDMALEANKIKQDFISNPNEGLKQLQARRQELFTSHKDSITDPNVKIKFDANGSHFLNQAAVLDQVWAFNANSSIIQKTHFDRIEQDSSFAGQTDNFAEVIGKANLLEKDREEFYKAWGGVAEGNKVVDAGQESMIKSYFYGQLSKGNAFKVLKEIEDGRLGPTEGNNGIISAMKLKEMKGIALRMATKDKNDAATLTLLQAVQTNFDIDGALNQPISVTEEKINSLSFEIAKKREQVNTGEVSPDEVKTLEEHQKMLELVRNKQISESNDQIVPDSVVEGEVTAQFYSLFKDKNPKKSFKGTAEDVFKFQQKLLESRDRISPKMFQQYSVLTEAAFQSDIQGFMKGSKFKTRQSWFGMGKELEAEDKNRLSTSKKFQNVFSDMIAKHDPKEGNAELFETMRIFYDDLTEILDLKDAPSVEAFSQKAMSDVVEGAKRKRQLQKMGLPVYLGEKDTVYKNGQAYTITGFQNGRPMVEPK